MILDVIKVIKINQQNANLISKRIRIKNNCKIIWKISIYEKRNDKIQKFSK